MAALAALLEYVESRGSLLRPLPTVDDSVALPPNVIDVPATSPLSLKAGWVPIGLAGGPDSFSWDHLSKLALVRDGRPRVHVQSSPSSSDGKTFRIEDSEMRKSIKADLRALGETSGRVEREFGEIYESLSSVVDSGFGSGFDVKVKWHGMRMEYSELWYEARGGAGDLFGQIKGFVRLLLPIGTVGSEDEPGDDDNEDEKLLFERKSALDSFIKTIEVFEAPALLRANRFLRLREDVGQFVGDVETQGTDGVEGRIKQVEDDIEGVERKIRLLKVKYDRIEDQSFNFLGGFFPGRTAALRKISDDIDAEDHDLKELHLGLEKEKREKEEIDQLVKVVKAHKSIVDDITLSLSGVERIWRMMLTDAQQLRVGLEKMEKEDDAFLYDLRVKSVRPVYDMLESTLEAYVRSQ